MTLSRKIFLPGVFAFSEEKPPYIARLLYETVTGLFSFLQALQNHHEKGGLFDGQRNYRNALQCEITDVIELTDESLDEKETEQ